MEPVDFTKPATVVRSPVHHGREAAWGGDWFVSVDGHALNCGADGERLASELARRWNHVANVCEHKFGNGIARPEGGYSAVCQKCGLVGSTDR